MEIRQQGEDLTACVASGFASGDQMRLQTEAEYIERTWGAAVLRPYTEVMCRHAIGR
jgi:hypothetical protein